MNVFNTRDILALGFMTFALFLGAGNIIFPPLVGLQSGENVWSAAIGFLITAVGLPVLTIIALARVNGSLAKLTYPIGSFFGAVIVIVCYLAIGPLFATPRTATVSYELGIVPLIDSNTSVLFIYSSIFFVIVFLLSLFPTKLLNSIGRVLSPLLILSLIGLGLSAFFFSSSESSIVSQPVGEYLTNPFSKGFIEGYLTMDTLGALAFGIVIITAIQQRGVKDSKQITKYTIIAGIIAGLGLMLVYVSLFKLGLSSSDLVPNAENGAAILHAFVNENFGDFGSIYLAIIIGLACISTAVGLTIACAEYFSSITSIPYKFLVCILVLFSFVISNIGLSQLIEFSLPVLITIYPPCVTLIVLSFFYKIWNSPNIVVSPTVCISFIFGLLNAIQGMDIKQIIPVWILEVPLASQGLGWLIPTLVILIMLSLIDVIFLKKNRV